MFRQGAWPEYGGLEACPGEPHGRRELQWWLQSPLCTVAMRPRRGIKQQQEKLCLSRDFTIQKYLRRAAEETALDVDGVRQLPSERREFDAEEGDHGERSFRQLVPDRCGFDTAVQADTILPRGSNEEEEEE